jgi:hypothetical protein
MIRARTLTLAVLVLEACAGGSAWAQDPQLRKCAAIADATARLACYDAAAAAAATPASATTAPTPATKAPATTAPAAATPAAAAPAAATAAAENAGPSSALAPHTGPSVPDSFGDNASLAAKRAPKTELPKMIEATITQAKPLGNGLYRLALDNGQVWETHEADWTLKFENSDVITISRLFSGGYQISMPGVSRTVSARRIQ